MPAEQALGTDAQFYARTYGVSLEEAQRRLKAQIDLGDTIAQLRQAHGERLAGIFIEHRPDYRVVVRLVGTDPVADAAAMTSGGTVPVVFRTGAAKRFEAIVDILEDPVKRQAVTAALPNVNGLAADPRTGDIVISVSATGIAAEAARAKAGELAALLGNTVRIETQAGEASLDHTRGGGTLATSTGALACTTGYSARDDAGTVGAVTAGHCGSSYYYKAPDGSNYLMSVTASKFDQFNPDSDLQYMVANHTTLGEFYADNSSTPRAVTGRRLQSSTGVGNYICHYGRYTGQSCGEVTSTAFAPNYSGGCGGSPCNPVFVKVEGPDLKCWGGDSGGPWFAWNTAFGIHSGSSKSSPNAGDCYWAAYTSTDKLSYLGVSLILS